MANKDDVHLALEEHEKRTHEKIGKEYTAIMNEFNENLKSLMDATVNSYKRLELFVKEEVQTIKTAISKEGPVGGGETGITQDPLQEMPNMQEKVLQEKIKKFNCKKCNFQTFYQSKLNEHNSIEHPSSANEEKVKKPKKQSKVSKSLRAEITNPKDDLYRKWDNAKFLQPDSNNIDGEDVDPIGGGLSVKLEHNDEEYEFPESYGSMEMGDNNENETFDPEMKGKVDDFIKRINKYAITNSATNAKRRLVGCKLCDLEMRSDRIRPHIQKEHKANLITDTNPSPEQEEPSKKPNKLQIVRLNKNKVVVPKREVKLEAFAKAMEANVKNIEANAKINQRVRDRPRAKCQFCQKEMRKDGIRQHIEKVHRAQLSSDLQGDEQPPGQDQPLDDYLVGNENSHDGTPEPGEDSGMQDDMAQDILSKFDKIRQHLEEVDNIEK